MLAFCPRAAVKLPATGLQYGKYTLYEHFNINCVKKYISVPNKKRKSCKPNKSKLTFRIPLWKIWVGVSLAHGCRRMDLKAVRFCVHLLTC